jgi:hypothetical protein
LERERVRVRPAAGSKGTATEGATVGCAKKCISNPIHHAITLAEFRELCHHASATLPSHVMDRIPRTRQLAADSTTFTRMSDVAKRDRKWSGNLVEHITNIVPKVKTDRSTRAPAKRRDPLSFAPTSRDCRLVHMGNREQPHRVT